jgi:hypothetical protein
MLVSFSIPLGVWYEPLGLIINKSMKDEKLSPLLKSVILSVFFNAFYLPK